MSIRTRAGRTLLCGVTCATVVAMTPVGIASATPAASAPPTVTVTMTNKAISFSGGTRIHAGTVLYKVMTPAGQHQLQLLQLHHGYTPQQAGKDFTKAFNGNVAAVRRLDRNITFYGGAAAAPGHPGYFTQSLRAGSYFAVDQNGPAANVLTVVGTPTRTTPVPHSSDITAFTYGFSQSPVTLPHAGWTFFHNQADQPHFLVMQKVKQSTTNADVQRYIKSGGHGQPPWALRPTAGTSVISPGVGMTWQYNLPPGKYLFACFWPDDQTGMPHFFMGMWKLVQLR